MRVGWQSGGTWGTWGTGGEGRQERGGDARLDSKGLADHQNTGGYKTVQCAGNFRSSIWLEQRIGF